MKKIGVDIDGFLTKAKIGGSLLFPAIFYLIILELIDLEPEKKNIEVVKNWKSLGFEIVIVSARPEITRETTEKWLKKNGIPFDKIFLVGPGRVKEKKLEILRKENIQKYFDDDIKIVSFLTKKGIDAKNK